MLMMIKNRLSLISNNNENDQSSYNGINRIIIEDYKNIEYNGNTPKKEQSLSQSPQLDKMDYEAENALDDPKNRYSFF